MLIKKKEEKKHFFHPSARSTKTLTTQSTPSNLKYVKVSKGAYNTQKLREDQDTVTFKDVTSSDEGIGTNSQKVKEKKRKKLKTPGKQGTMHSDEETNTTKMKRLNKILDAIDVAHTNESKHDEDMETGFDINNQVYNIELSNTYISNHVLKILNTIDRNIGKINMSNRLYAVLTDTLADTGSNITLAAEATMLTNGEIINAAVAGLSDTSNVLDTTGELGLIQGAGKSLIKILFHHKSS